MEQNYIVVKNALSEEISDICYKYFLLKRDATYLKKKANYLPPFNNDHGTFYDGQVNNAYSIYGDILFDSLLEKIKPIMEEKTKLKLIPTYSYARVYEKGNILPKHKDRNSCKISTTINLGGDPWPIYVEPDPSKGSFKDSNTYIASDSKGIEINLSPGDMLIYKGCDLEHWRNIFNGDLCGQLFLHYLEHTEENLKYLMDGRPSLGLPNWFIGYKTSNVE